MKSLVVLMSFFALVLGFAQAAPVPKERQKPDARLLLGTWKVVDIDRGRPNGLRTTSNAQWTLGESGAMTITAASGLNPRRYQYTIDPNKNPKEFSYKVEAATTHIQGIYELNGDTLKICYALSGRERPTSMEAKPGQYIYTFRRVDTKE